MKTILIVKSNPDDLRKEKEYLIQNEERKRQLVKYSDSAVETKTKLYIFKVIPLPRHLLDQIRGYSEVKADYLLRDLDKFVEEVKAICIGSSPEGAESPRISAKVGADTNILKDDKKSGEEQE